MITHYDESVGEQRDLVHDNTLIGVGLAENRVESRNHRHLQTPEQTQNMASRGATEDTVFMLQRDEIDVAEIQKIGSVLIGRRIAFREFESNPRRITVVRTRVIDWNCQQLSRLVLCADGVAKICRKRRNPT